MADFDPLDIFKAFNENDESDDASESDHDVDEAEKDVKEVQPDTSLVVGESSQPQDDDVVEEKPVLGTKRVLDSECKEDELPSKLIKNESFMDGINLDNLSSRVKVITVETVEKCVHELAIPPDMEYVPLRPLGTPAKEYPFILDPFQKEAILCIDNNQSVLVSAHTSAGKTVVAEYSIAMSLREKQRVIYTTPIKALSNQKYREFHEEFRDVGLVTGDVTINPSASCLIMTTEILRNMLYRGSEIMREVGWVVFDEIHYMRNKERGVVWEETLILLPDNVHYVFLSATIPNARQFAEWVAHLHHQPCHVVYTDYRPTPLQHYLFPAGGEGIHLIVDEHGQFREDNFTAAMTVLANAGDAAKGDRDRGRRGGQKGGDSNCFKIVKLIMERNFAPVIVFSFSKKECEMYAMMMSQLNLNSNEERELVNEVFNNAMSVLSEEDRKLPQVELVLPLLWRGIGIHHGGLLPILKETIEILFSEGLIKALFATETFAMGLNMPARTVLFTGARKFDGKENRSLTSGEYIQMSGRAGRRGLDDKGIVILMVDERLSEKSAKDILQGEADPINSAFHLTYNMVLNLLRVEEINPEYMLERSFFQFQNNTSIPNLVNKIKELEEKESRIVVPKESQVSSYFSIRDHLKQLGARFQEFISKPEYLISFLQPGRMIKIKDETEEYDWGIVINFKKLNASKGGKNPATSKGTLEIEVLLNLAESQLKSPPKPCPEGTVGEIEVVKLSNTVVNQISSIRLYYPTDLRPPDNRKFVLKLIQEVKKRFPDGVPLLNPIDDMKITDPGFKEICDQIAQYEERLFKHPLHGSPDLQDLYSKYSEKIKVEKELKSAKLDLKSSMSLLHMEDLKCRKRVLRRLGYCTASDVIEMKGRVACELSSGEELLLTEMIFNGVFNDLTVPQTVALLSCFVCDEKTKETPKRTEELRGPLRKMQELARRVARVSIESKLEMDEDEYVESLRPSLTDVCYAWCLGSSFLQICEMTDIFEGSIIRCMRRLEELLRQMVQASKNIGNTDLENKFSEAIKVIKRDIVFAASLYL
ncbi:exosome RNA helicase MTR4 [Nilaparvata lugens]|uniref:exosome RNA helicase MTR4 n=1 Tax=Nilaparvata lugens TaxID=108931 RepID=UPI000B99C529|nr:exosome RNA helicase MTR4 [Nilaparvata lugens]